MSEDNGVLFRVVTTDLLKQGKLPTTHYSISFDNSKLKN